ncbi:acyl-CoA N-acyltransferase [Chytriomyces cf. hyalinus JEL632]|nr:acyl-CoA N-acyltransferase [Chytriomyces cf. hyalinus JEL632]
MSKTGAYGVIPPPADGPLGPLPLPSSVTLRDGTAAIISQVDVVNESQATLDFLRHLLNTEIERGDTYPYEFIMDDDAFKAYFLSATAFMVSSPDRSQIMGTFYIKPNYPGRCSHVCNGGFITNSQFRGQGVGKLMAKAFLTLAPLLGYKASVFNLVFETNTPSVNLWRSLGFKEVGRIPKAGRLNGHDKRVDAIVFYYDFDDVENKTA